MSEDAINSGFIQLERRLLGATTPEELNFILVNEMRAVVPYDQAAIINLAAKYTGTPLFLSGIAIADRNAPYCQFLLKLGKALPEKFREQEVIDLKEVELPGKLSAEWADWLAASVIAVPVFLGDGSPTRVLVLGRPNDWTDPERQWLGQIATVFGLCAAKLEQGPGVFKRVVRAVRLRPLLILTALIALAFVPIRFSVQGPGEIAPLAPVVVRSPVNAVVQSLLVEAYEEVGAKQPLAAFDRLEIDARIVVAVEKLNKARSELRRAEQQTLQDPRERRSIPALEEQVKEAENNLDYLRKLRLRYTVLAPGNGIALIENHDQWRGRTVQIGEKLMIIADPDKVEIKAWIPAEDAWTVRTGDIVRLFPEITPESPVEGIVRTISFEPTTGPNGLLSHEVRARIDLHEGRKQLGLYGVARVLGEHGPLAMFVLRRPLAIMRRWLGF